MTLSSSAENYINTLDRNPEWISSASAIQKYLSRYRLENSDRLFQIQQDYSGYTFSPDLNSDYAVRLYFLSDAITAKNQKIYYTTIDGKAAFSMDNSKTEPYYLIAENGAVWYWDDAVNQYFCLYESIEIMIEIYALERDYQYHSSFPAKDLASENVKAIMDHFNRHYTFVPECSDRYQYYWQTDYDLIRILYNDYEKEYSLVINSVSPYNFQLILDGLKRDNLYL
ncbi:hypothetical protein E6C50_09010 [Flavobacterium supellecticarium]|uniref:Uncharacterized protein n=1 Tax=Flavobacterium supellecticarium TaxID=2565924 RepID=A0A4S4A0Q6_9FLAO|nr:hypothetical protein [Flavobacterium supellecticarium]THF51881.1 hypothetical protein E6C50_09010 [Flavobacterium supellecticarium]